MSTIKKIYNWIKAKLKWLLIGSTALAAGIGGITDAQINPYEDKGTHYELPVSAEIAQGERVEISKDKAEMTLKGWNDEYAIKITPQIPTAAIGGPVDKVTKKLDIDNSFKKQASRSLFSKKMEFKEGDVTAFIEPKAGTENEFDIDFTLDSKPSTNVFTYKIEGAEEFDFFYQPELTKAEIKEGSSLPENAVGSYAVYHKTKANHRVGHTNYGNGKAFHIYRPKAIDANGAEVWAELSYISGQLEVTVPQKFLDEAAYPIVVDPTFGYTSIGVGSIVISAEGSGTLNRSTTVGHPETLSEDATVTTLSAALRTATNDTGPVFLALYNEDSAGSGSHALIVSAENATLAVTTTATNYDISASGSLTAADSPYILAALANGGTGGFHAGSFQTCSVMFDNTGSRNNYSETTDAAGSYTTRKAEDPWTETASVSDDRYSIYVTYTASGGSAPIEDVGNTSVYDE